MNQVERFRALLRAPNKSLFYREAAKRIEPDQGLSLINALGVVCDAQTYSDLRDPIVLDFLGGHHSTNLTENEAVLALLFYAELLDNE